MRIQCDNCNGGHKSCAVCHGTGYKLQHGGKRPNAGRKPKEPTTTKRIPISLVPKVDELIKNHKSKSK